MNPRIETFKGKGRKPWRYRLVGSNGETIATSQGYSRKWNRKRAVKHLAKQTGFRVVES